MCKYERIILIRIINTIYVFMHCNEHGDFMESILLGIGVDLILGSDLCRSNMAYNSNINIIVTAL